MDTYPLKEKVSRLIQYINELSQLRQKPITSFRNYEEVLLATSHSDLSLLNCIVTSIRIVILPF